MRLDKSKFIAWLKAKPPDEIVGRSRSPSCPIANFYDEAAGNEIIIYEVWGDYFADRGYSKKRLPAWASDFVTEVDHADGEISAKRALDALSCSSGASH